MLSYLNLYLEDFLFKGVMNAMKVLLDCYHCFKMRLKNIYRVERLVIKILT